MFEVGATVFFVSMLGLTIALAIIGLIFSIVGLVRFCRGKRT